MTVRLPTIGGTLLVCLALAPGAAAQTLTRGPTLGKVDGDGVVVRFEIDVPAAIEVRYGPTDAYGSAVTAPAGTAFEIELPGLGPGATVHYRPFAGSTPLGDDHVFRTAPPPRAPLRFLVFGDTRSDHDAHWGVVAGILPHAPWFGVNTGDLVSSGDVAEDWSTFFAIEEPLLADVPLFAAAGNHENTDTSRLFVDNLALPDDSPGSELYYSWDYGNVHGIVLDHYVNVDPEWLCLTRIGWWEKCFDAAQNAWLAADLAVAAGNPDIDHVFVFVHEGPYSSKAGRDGSYQLRALLDTFVEHGVRILFSGHDHYYERGFSGNGLPYVVTGGGGAPLYDPDTPTFAPHTIEVAEPVHHFVIVEIDGLDASLTAYRLDGSVLDTFSYTAPPRGCWDPSVDCGTLPPDCVGGRWICEPDVCVAVDCSGGGRRRAVCRHGCQRGRRGADGDAASDADAPFLMPPRRRGRGSDAPARGRRAGRSCDRWGGPAVVAAWRTTREAPPDTLLGAALFPRRRGRSSSGPRRK